MSSRPSLFPHEIAGSCSHGTVASSYPFPQPSVYSLPLLPPPSPLPHSRAHALQITEKSPHTQSMLRVVIRLVPTGCTIFFPLVTCRLLFAVPYQTPTLPCAVCASSRRVPTISFGNTLSCGRVKIAPQEIRFSLTPPGRITPTESSLRTSHIFRGAGRIGERKSPGARISLFM